MMRSDINMDKEQVNLLFELTELHLYWFNKFHNDNIPTFNDLLKRNHIKIKDYLNIHMLGVYTPSDITAKLNKLYDTYHTLIEITKLNRNTIDTSSDSVRLLIK